MIFENSEEHFKIYLLEGENQYDRSVLVKQIKCYDREKESRSMDEARIAKGHPHPHICEYIDFFIEPDPPGSYVYIITEYMRRSLQDDITQRVSTSFPNYYNEATLWKFLLDSVSAFEFLESIGTAHRDIKPCKIHFDINEEIKVCDFAMAKASAKDGVMLATIAGSCQYYSPDLRLAWIKGEKDTSRVEHNIFKSDVFSLGVTMLQLSLLDLPEQLSDLKDFDNKMKVFIESQLQERYSSEWVQILELMLKRQETDRPNFSKLSSRILELCGTVPMEREFSDDEPIPRMIIGCDVKEPLQVTMKYGVNYARVSPNQSETIPCLLTLRTSSYDVNLRESSMDLVCVIDQSASMADCCNESMDLAKKTLSALVELIGARDRISLISFSDEAKLICPLVLGSPERKAALLEQIQLLETLDTSNLEVAINLALKVICQRRMKNTAVALLLFSDGKVNREDVNLGAIGSHIEGLRVRCFSFGRDANVQQMQQFAGRAEFHAQIGGEESPSEVLTRLLPQLSTGIATQVLISVESLENDLCFLKSVYSSDSQSFSVPILAPNEQLHFVFELKTKHVECAEQHCLMPVAVKIEYFDSSCNSKSEEVKQTLRFVPRTDAAPPQDKAVFIQYIRVRGAHYFFEARDLMNEGKFAEAEQKLRNGITELSENDRILRKDPLVKKVKKDLKAAAAMTKLTDRASWAQLEKVFDFIGR